LKAAKQSHSLVQPMTQYMYTVSKKPPTFDLL